MGYLESQVYDNHKSDRWLTHVARTRDSLRAKLRAKLTSSEDRTKTKHAGQLCLLTSAVVFYSEFTKTKEEIRRGESSSKMSWKKNNVPFHNGKSLDSWDLDCPKYPSGNLT